MAKFATKRPLFYDPILPFESDIEEKETTAFRENKGQLVILAHKDGRSVVVNKKCLNFSSDQNDETLPYCNILDKYHDALRYAKQVPLVAGNGDSEVPEYNEDIDKFDKYTQEDLEEQKQKGIVNPKFPRKARHLDGSVALDKLIVGDYDAYSLPNKEGEYTLFFNEYNFDISNFYIGSPAQNAKTEGINLGVGQTYGIIRFLHQVDTSIDHKESKINLGLPKQGELSIKDGYSSQDIIRDSFGNLNLMDSQEKIRIKIMNLDGGIKLEEWDEKIDVQELVDQYTYKSENWPFGVKNGDEFKNWYGLRNECFGGGGFGGGIFDRKDPNEREDNQREQAEIAVNACGYGAKLSQATRDCLESFRNPNFGVSPQEPQYFEGFEICDTLATELSVNKCIGLKTTFAHQNGREDADAILDLFLLNLSNKSPAHKFYLEEYFDDNVQDCCRPMEREVHRSFGGGSICGFLSTPADVCGCGYVDSNKTEESELYEAKCKFSVPLNIINKGGVSRSEDADYLTLL